MFICLLILMLLRSRFGSSHSVSRFGLGVVLGNLNQMVPVSFPRRRSRGVDIDDKDAKKILAEHVVAVAAQDAMAVLWKYSKSTVKEATSWPELWRCRHCVADLIACTRGNLLNRSCWERQVPRDASLHVRRDGFRTLQKLWRTVSGNHIGNNRASIQLQNSNQSGFVS